MPSALLSCVLLAKEGHIEAALDDQGRHQTEAPVFEVGQLGYRCHIDCHSRPPTMSASQSKNLALRLAMARYTPEIHPG